LFILGAVIGTVVCSMLNTEQPQEIPHLPHYRPPPNNTNRKPKTAKTDKSKSIKLYLNVL